MKGRLILLAALAAIVIAFSWYRQGTGTPDPQRLAFGRCTDAQDRLYSEGAVAKLRGALVRCSDGKWVPYSERQKQ
ncbi:MAG TPA: hypothetical protein VN428_18040 [Bryobacteraceae bacterium]|nr:hypothetical protein [Bryobacteraceae bacterium]